MKHIQVNSNFVRFESPSRTEYAIKGELHLEPCPLFASKKTIYWYRLIHPIEELLLGAEQQGEEEFYHSICRPKKALRENSSDLHKAIQRRVDEERRSGRIKRQTN